MPKVRLNENEEIVRTIKEGLAAKGDTVPAELRSKRNTNACVRSSEIR